jgi:hypothetical protein
MAAGILQMVGESRWQLSHGEKSRLLIARALLGRGDLMILDESVGALDPENLRAPSNTCSSGRRPRSSSPTHKLGALIKTSVAAGTPPTLTALLVFMAPATS